MRRWKNCHNTRVCIVFHQFHNNKVIIFLNFQQFIFNTFSKKRRKTINNFLFIIFPANIIEKIVIYFFLSFKTPNYYSYYFFNLICQIPAGYDCCSHLSLILIIEMIHKNHLRFWYFRQILLCYIFRLIFRLLKTGRVDNYKLLTTCT